MTTRAIQTNAQKSAHWLAWLLLAVTVAAIVAGFTLMGLDCRELLVGAPYQRFLPFTFATSNLFFAALGILILKRQPGQRMGWLCAVIGATTAIQSNYGLVHGSCTTVGAAGTAFAFWLFYAFGFIVTFETFVLLPMLFPDGHFLTRRWRLLTLAGGIWIAILVALIVLLPGPMIWNGGTGTTNAPDNPVALSLLPKSMGPTLDPLVLFSMFVMFVAAIVSMILRYRRSQGATRQQMKWFVYYVAVFIMPWAVLFEIIGALFYPEIFDTLLYAVVTSIVVLGFPVVIGVAVLRYRLYDIDFIIRRTLVYAVVTSSLTLVYIGSIIVLQRLFVAVSGQQSTVAIVLSTLLIATLFSPLRRRTQRLIERRFYRRRYNAQRVLERFAEVSRNEVDLAALEVELAAVVRETILPASVSVWLKG